MLIILIGSFQTIFVDNVKNVQVIAKATYHCSFLTQGLFKKSDFFLLVIGEVLKA